MKPDKGVFQRRGSAVWQHRIYVPKDLQPLYGGKDALPAKSLGTRNLSEANRLARLRVAEFEREFAARRDAHSGKGGASCVGAVFGVSHEAIERLAAGHARKVVAQDFTHRVTTFQRASADPEAFWRGEIISLPEDDWEFSCGHFYSYWARLKEDPTRTLDVGVAYALQVERQVRLAKLKQAYASGNVEVLVPEAKALLASYQQSETDRLRLVQRLMELEIAARMAIVNEQAENIPPPTSECEDDKENPLLSAAAKSWLAEKESLDLTARRIEDCEAAFALFVEVIGDKPVAKYTKGDVREFKKVLRALPANRSKIQATRGLDARSAAKTAQRLGLEPMSTKTANNKYIATLYNLFEYALGNYDRVDRNPFVNATLPTRTNPREEWDPFTIEALRTFFHAPLYTGCKSVRVWMEPGDVVPRDSARFWLPLILLYSGARVNEACKLRVIDIGEAEGTPFFSIEWEEDDEEQGIAGRVKNVSSERRVPIHDDLVGFGFLDFVARARTRGSERLFPELKPNRHGKLYGTISQRFSDTFLPRLGIKTEKTSLKSFRHNFVDAARNSSISDPVIQALKGDTFEGTLARYGHGKTDLEILAAEMKKLRFKGLDLSHLLATSTSGTTGKI